MFSLYIVINHNKLLNKSLSINENEILDILFTIIEKRSGVISEFSPYFSYFPSKYEYSKHNFIVCLQELHKELTELSDLVGFSLIVDNYEPESEFEYSEWSSFLHLQTTDIDKIWFTKKSYKLIAHIFKAKRHGELVKVPNSFFDIKFTHNQIDSDKINHEIQSIFDGLTDTVTYFESDMNIALYRDITYWANIKSYEQVIYLDFGFSSDKKLTFIDHIITLKSIFDPTRDLDSRELKNWGRYINLYEKFCNRSHDCFIIDDAEIHFNKLITLWVECFTIRFKTLFIIKYDDDFNKIEELWSLISQLKNIKLFIFKKEFHKIGTHITLPELPGLKFELKKDISDFLNIKSDESLMILYIALITGGSIPVVGLLYILKSLNFNILKLREELDNYKRIGFLLGEQNLYTGSDDILGIIKQIRPKKVLEWKNNFLKAFMKVGYQNIFSYSYTFSLLALDSDFKHEALDVLYLFVQKILDLKRNINLSLEFVDKSFEDCSLKNILEYKKIREHRLNYIIDDVSINKQGENSCRFQTPLEYMDLLNLWSNNIDGDLINRCKKLYFSYQSTGEKFNESRIKILFSLGLLSIGSVSEAVDYFDLNINFSKSISDKYSYIRNGCFLSASLFIKGDMSGVIRVSNHLLTDDWIFFKSRWMLYLKFIRIRALTELGFYTEALEVLERGLAVAKSFHYKDITVVYTNWIGRVLYYLGREAAGREAILSNTSTNEGFFFLSEMEFYSGNMNRALFYIDKVDLSCDDNILFDENLKWRDGFFIVEEFFNRKERSSILFQEIKNYRLMLNILNFEDNAIVKYFDIIGAISNNSIGIHDYRYIYYLYKSTEDMELNKLFNRDNLLNKIVRLLQQRASNIAEHNQKHFYLNNFYNKPIIEISRTKKLF